MKNVEICKAAYKFLGICKEVLNINNALVPLGSINLKFVVWKPTVTCVVSGLQIPNIKSVSSKVLNSITIFKQKRNDINNSSKRFNANVIVNIVLLKQQNLQL